MSAESRSEQPVYTTPVASVYLNRGDVRNLHDSTEQLYRAAAAEHVVVLSDNQLKWLDGVVAMTAPGGEREGALETNAPGFTLLNDAVELVDALHPDDPEHMARQALARKILVAEMNARVQEVTT